MCIWERFIGRDESLLVLYNLKMYFFFFFLNFGGNKVEVKFNEVCLMIYKTRNWSHQDCECIPLRTRLSPFKRRNLSSLDLQFLTFCRLAECFEMVLEAKCCVYVCGCAFSFFLSFNFFLVFLSNLTFTLLLTAHFQTWVDILACVEPISALQQ